ncbi:hypothetical protein LCGC14_1554320 [marine sediment metagenome]|uniref:Uncharacterized protein n=1 Tax=marine sediment metagenome TaxID=412755 RepID=A0A0F9IPE2_9ZZZZ
MNGEREENLGSRIERLIREVEEIRRSAARSGVDSIGHPRRHGSADHLLLAFLSLSDTPGSYSGQSLLAVRVNAAETGLEFFAAAGGHNPVTLAADAQELLNLSVQELGFVAKAMNLVLAGPVSGGATDPTFRALVAADLPTLKVSKSIMFHFPAEDMAVGDFVSESAIRVPAAGKHGTWTPGMLYVRCTVAGTGTNIIAFATSTTLTGGRTARATVNLGTSREASTPIVWTPADGQYLWVICIAVGATAPKRPVAQIDLEEAVY